MFLSSEVALREIWGFCDAPLSIESEKYEYIFAPSQDRFRFRNHVKYNSFSQRSEEPKKKKKILGCGDSVINGGAHTDQRDIATTLFEKLTGVQMLNISAGSWGPDNCAAYIEDKGTFDADGIILVVSSHDAHDNMDWQPVVGQSEAFPDKQYKLALWELIDRYLFPRVAQLLKCSRSSNINENDPDAAVNAGIQKRGRAFNPGFEQLRKIAEKNGIPFAVYLHPEAVEVEAKEYNKGGREIIEWAQKNNVKLYLGLNEGEDLDGFRDNIHLNELGQLRLAMCFEKIYSEWLN